MTQTAPQERILMVAFELSNRKWKLTFGTGTQARRRTEIEAGDFEALEKELRRAKHKLGVAQDARVVSCYEAGRDGFWIHRRLEALGIGNVVVDAASIQVPRRERRAKSDRLDGEALLRMLARHVGGEEKVWSVVRVPSEEEEEARRRHRELERLKHERTGHRCRISGLLALHGLKVKVNRDFLGRLEHLRTWKGKPLGRETQGELRREYGRLKLVEEQIRELERAAEEEVEAAREDPGKASPALRKVVALKQLRGVNESAWPLVREFFGWREFRNRREVGSLAGLTGTPYQSGDTSRDLGISKAGNRRIRALMVELAWSWLRYQPHSKLSVWYQERFGAVGKRNRRVGIVALARKLLVALWKYVENSELPEGAELKAGA